MDNILRVSLKLMEINLWAKLYLLLFLEEPSKSSILNLEAIRFLITRTTLYPLTSIIRKFHRQQKLKERLKIYQGLEQSIHSQRKGGILFHLIKSLRDLVSVLLQHLQWINMYKMMLREPMLQLEQSKLFMTAQTCLHSMTKKIQMTSIQMREMLLICHPLRPMIL